MTRICAGCNRPVLTRYITAMRKSWHPECFCCSFCHQPITSGRFYIHDGLPCCREDYFQYFAVRCFLCGQPIRGSFRLDSEGNKICSKRDAAHRICFSCSKTQKQLQGQSFYRLSDGRMYCQSCHSGLLSDPAAINLFFQEITNALCDFGVQVDPRTVCLKTGTQAELCKRSPRRSKIRPLGLTLTRQVRVMGMPVRHELEGILVLVPLPRVHLGMVLAHEATHVWMYQQKFPRLTPQVEEGLCEFISYLWLEKQEAPLARHLMQRLQQNTSRTYGNGFRKAYARYTKEGLKALMQRVYLQKTL